MSTSPRLSMRRPIVGGGSSLIHSLRRPVAAVLLFTGCFHYVPAAVSPLPPEQTEIRVTLADPIDITMGDFTLNDVTRIEGIVAEANGDTLGLVAKWLYPRFGRKYDALFGSYDIPVSGIEQLETWRFSGKRTALVVGAAAAVTAFAVAAVWRAVAGGGGGEPPPPAISGVVPR